MRALSFASLAALLAIPVLADDIDAPAAAAADSAESALKKFTVAPGLQVDVWAAEPLLANPVAFTFDDRGRAYVAETYRRRSSVPDIRKNDPWKIENLALRSVEDRVSFLKAKYSESAKMKPTRDLADRNADGQFDWRDLEHESERIKLITDTNGDGKADSATVFAEGFQSLATGIGAGLAVHGGAVFYTCAPDLWRFEDGKRTALATGFGVHVVFSGHDMHGARFGPDGKLYWSIADCGARVTTKEGTVIENADSGGVFRCNADGTHLELVATGLRNPQHLCFNDVGDLFTGDNNADGGDRARWTHVVDGADYGWRIGWQFLPKLGAWNSEGMWFLDVAKTNLSLLPPVAHIGHGPAGIAWYPGTGLPESYRGHFFYADFPGGVRAFPLQPSGASYTAENPGDVLQDNSQKEMTGKLLWGLYPSDVQFGSDGGAYVLDWIQGWEKTGKGRIFRVHDPATDASAIVQETKRLLAEGMEKRSRDEMGKLLGHADQRVRLAAQWALAASGESFAVLSDVAANSAAQLARLHAIWGLGQLADAAARAKNQTAWRYLEPLIPLLQDRDSEVRAQAAKVLGTSTNPAHSSALIRLLRDPQPRVRFFTAQALGRIGREGAMKTHALAELYWLLRDNSDAFIRHAAARALSQLADSEMLVQRADDESDAVRTGVLLALRQHRSPEVARFLTDKNPQLVLEAARAIHDAPIPAAWPQLAALAEKAGLPEHVARRAVNVNYLLGSGEDAQRLAKIAADAKAAPTLRLDAIEALGVWNLPFGRDRITGLWRKLPPGRDADGAIKAAAVAMPALLGDASDAIRLAAAQMAGTLRVTAVQDALAQYVSAAGSGSSRAAALRALDAMDSPRLPAAVKLALADKDKTLLEAARKLAAKASPEDAVRVNAGMLGKGSIREQQEALATIAAQRIPEADAVLSAQLDLLLAGKLPSALHLDLLEAAALRTDANVKHKLATSESARKTDDPLAKWRECMDGGDAKAGREIFAEKAEAACMRCHKVKGEGGDVGPDLAAPAAKRDRAHLLQSIVDPNAVITAGYENVLLTLADGAMIAGLLSAEDATDVTIASVADGKKQKVKKAQIKERMKVPSAMPPGLGEVLGKRALRDVIEYLATLK